MFPALAGGTPRVPTRNAAVPNVALRRMLRRDCATGDSTPQSGPDSTMVSFGMTWRPPSLISVFRSCDLLAVVLPLLYVELRSHGRTEAEENVIFAGQRLSNPAFSVRRCNR